MERLTSREPRASGMPGVCCSHFRGKDCEAAQGCCSDGCPWEEAAWERLAAYEDTELEPEEIVSVQEEPWCVFYFNRRCNLDGDFCPEGPGCPQEMSPEDAVRLLKLAKAEKDGRLVVLPDAKYTDADGEKALKKAMWTCWNTNNPVTRYTAEAIAEKLCREAKEGTS